MLATPDLVSGSDGVLERRVSQNARKFRSRYREKDRREPLRALIDTWPTKKADRDEKAYHTLARAVGHFLQGNLADARREAELLFAAYARDYTLFGQRVATLALRIISDTGSASFEEAVAIQRAIATSWARQRDRTKFAMAVLGESNLWRNRIPFDIGDDNNSLHALNLARGAYWVAREQTQRSRRDIFAQRALVEALRWKHRIIVGHHRSPQEFPKKDLDEFESVAAELGPEAIFEVLRARIDRLLVLQDPEGAQLALEDARTILKTQLPAHSPLHVEMALLPREIAILAQLPHQQTAARLKRVEYGRYLAIQATPYYIEQGKAQGIVPPTAQTQSVSAVLTCMYLTKDFFAL